MTYIVEIAFVCVFLLIWIPLSFALWALLKEPERLKEPDRLIKNKTKKYKDDFYMRSLHGWRRIGISRPDVKESDECGYFAHRRHLSETSTHEDVAKTNPHLLPDLWCRAGAIEGLERTRRAKERRDTQDDDIGTAICMYPIVANSFDSSSDSYSPSDSGSSSSFSSD